jgi:hypothetical protein
VTLVPGVKYPVKSPTSLPNTRNIIGMATPAPIAHSAQIAINVESNLSPSFRILYTNQSAYHIGRQAGGSVKEQRTM